MWVAWFAYTPFRQRVVLDVAWHGVSERGTLAFTFVVTLAISIALLIMLVWQMWLAVSAQTTIEFYFNRWQASQARKDGTEWTQPYDRGFAQNFRDFFNAHDRFWWITWALPSLDGSSGDGVHWPNATDGARDALFGEHYV